MKNKPGSQEGHSKVAHEHPTGPPEDARRGFLTRFAAIVFGGLSGLVPVGAGLAVLLDPLRRKSSSEEWLRVAQLNSIPDDGVARYYPVVTDRADAWNKYVDEPIGAVFLRRPEGSQTVECLNAICPHAGCFVAFNATEKQFQCPCHDSKWQPDGVRLDPATCPSPRDLDSLEVDSEKLAQGEIWVRFQNFLTATHEKIPKA
jgi:menaquinol-cytochrome c reductase iron-sulfur subunit